MAEVEKYTAKDVQEARMRLESTFLQGDFWYATLRGFHNFEDSRDQGYLSYLPPLEGLNFETIVEGLIEQSPQAVNILDIACGEGNFLKECLERWGRRVKGFGVDLRPGTTSAFEKATMFIQGRHLDMQLGDGHDLNEIFPPNSMDVATSVRTLEYMADPWSVVKKIHRVLKPGGIALLSYVPFNMNKLEGWREYEFDSEGANSLVDHLRTKYGMEIRIVDDEYCDLSFRKTTDKLWLPLSYSNNVTHRLRILPGFDTLQFTSVGYRFNS